ncbi:ADP-ribosylglycohydrolase family protein [Ruminococcus sp.]|uniref:ADP-ribosylglycohydrolase family protein n=1 Tax=Ruminococcus sp. TaxID=41978 RepID=UPI0025DB5DAE|nr:ADP-ribosylglycohydrolase family protein [Ruminococcus sp.]MBQ8967867.1 ADP-ribosylglycohydrolase family protein [Ruminococcus sp.]
MKDIHKLKGGIFGLLVGDALGVPYEFHEPEDIPPLENIEMTPPEGFMRAHSMVKPATWSDDGAQALCLLDSLVEKGGFDLEDFSRKILAWYDKGLWAVGGRVFDVGIQTGMSLDAFRGGVKPEKAGLIRPDGKGNGALMRVLPLALWHEGSNEQLVDDAHRQCLITHGNITNQVCCALYVLMARELLKGNDTESALDSSAAEIRRIYADKPEYSDEFEFRIRPEEPDFWQGSGGGYVLDSLKSTVMLLRNSSTYEEVVKGAVALGHDTDTTACIAGGLAGIIYGYEGIPSRWLEELREKEKVDSLLERWLGQ